MKIFKIILILVLLLSISFGVCGERNDILKSSSSHDTLEIDETYGKWIFKPEEAETLIEWFKDLILDEKVEIYNWWKNKNIDWEECIKMPLIIEDEVDPYYFMLPKGTWDYDLNKEGE